VASLKGILIFDDEDRLGGASFKGKDVSGTDIFVSGTDIWAKKLVEAGFCMTQLGALRFGGDDKNIIKHVFARGS
jgi:hypothetical protein